MSWVRTHLPSTVSPNLSWIFLNKPDPFVQRQEYVSNACGKWMLFPATRNHDQTWLQLAEALSLGSFSISMKTCPSKEPGQGANLICIYTEDWEDQEDVLRVGLNVLRLCTWVTQINYKPDIFTEDMEGIHGSNKLPLTIFSLKQGDNHLTRKLDKCGRTALNIARVLMARSALGLREPFPIQWNA